ncbi:hypothetical protein M4951_02165 [Blastopirellula sp. J2-11]|uniref:hypothetical protein n=1 Tax=Blastopirellula sp. J2-11 TaxID=2943192 RepID=UPI0021C66EF6|nr:hypothetical protein [Blastopirellula sp. J2-11]UUO07126.1 hypothetical protein M4951_02165 [Blastopirellula sp. J2-11]
MRFTWLLAAACWTMAAQPARSDTVILASGGKISGDLQESAGDLDAPQRIVSSYGVVELASEQIVEIEREPPELEQYRERASRAAATIVDQWSLVKWCRENGLYDEANRHCEQIVKLDPDHEQARKLLGFRKRNGEWSQREDYMQSRGFIRYQGRWRTHQQVQLMEEKRLIKAAQVAWYVRLKRWRESLGTPHERENQIDFSQLRDPMAMHGLMTLLGREDNLKLQRLYIETLGNLDRNAALSFLLNHSVYQNNPDHREMCMIEVLKHRHPQMIERYARFLTSYDNNLVNRAADCLAALEYPSAVLPLANALRTRVIMREFRKGANGQVFEKNAIYHYSRFPVSQRFDIVGPTPSYRMRTVDDVLESSQNAHAIAWVENPHVYSALRNLTGGGDFGYNAASWKAWHTQRQVSATPVIQARREN